MSYNIVKTNGQPLATVPDGQTNSTATSLTLIGKNYAGYGTFMNENFVKLLENFASANAPQYPLTGQLWWKTDTRLLQVYDTNGNWKTISGAQSLSDAPSTPVAGDLWWDTVNQQLKTYSGAAWIVIGPSFTATTGQSGAIADTIVDSSGTSHVVVKFYVQNNLIAILSKDAAFTPGTTISGFGTVSPGFNLAANRSPALTYLDTANNALSLGGRAASQYVLQSTPVFTNKVQVWSTGGFEMLNNIGTTSLFTLDQSAGSINLISKSQNYGFTIQTAPDQQGGGIIAALTVSPSTGLITVYGDPVDAQGVSTKRYVDTASAAQTAALAATNNSLSNRIDTLTGNVSSIYSNVRVSQSDLGYNNPAAVPNNSQGYYTPVGGTASIAYNKIVGNGDTFAGNLLNLWANLSAIHSSLLSATGTAPSSQASALNNITYLINKSSSLDSGVLKRDGSNSVTNTLRPETDAATSTPIDFGQDSKRFGTFYGITGSFSNISHQGTSTSGNIGGITTRFGTAFVDVLDCNTIKVGGTGGGGGVVLGATGASNRIIVGGTLSSGGVAGVGPYSGSITLTLPQDIGTSSQVTFANVITSGLSAYGSSATVYGQFVLGTGASFQATYADLGEFYKADAAYVPGTVVRLGGDAEVTQETEALSGEVFGVVSTDPAYVMNRPESATDTDVIIATVGRVPVRVVGTGKKGQRLVSAGNGVARAAAHAGELTQFNIIGRLLADKDTAEEGLVEAAVRISC